MTNPWLSQDKIDGHTQVRNVLSSLWTSPENRTLFNSDPNRPTLKLLWHPAQQETIFQIWIEPNTSGLPIEYLFQVEPDGRVRYWFIFSTILDPTKGVTFWDTWEKLAFYWNPPVSQQWPLPAADTTAPNTWDPATDTLIDNMRTRINQLETALVNLWLLQ